MIWKIYYLPEYLIDNHQIYSILIEKIHKLSKEKVNKHFEVMKKCIYIILDDFLYTQEDRKLIKEIKASINTINSEIKSN